jgi:hypothetical protein
MISIDCLNIRAKPTVDKIIDTGDTILSVEPSFVMYGMIAKFTRLNYQGVDLNDDFEILPNSTPNSLGIPINSRKVCCNSIALGFG